MPAPVKTEDDPLDPHPPANFQTTLDAIRYLERTVLAADGLEGVVLRYAGFTGREPRSARAANTLR
jgi:hypothetical protein